MKYSKVGGEGGEVEGEPLKMALDRRKSAEVMMAMKLPLVVILD